MIWGWDPNGSKLGSKHIAPSRPRLPLIVVVDDSEVVLAAARSTLEAAGCRVITHPRAAGCVALILQEKPDLVLMDVNLPGIPGDTIAKLFGKARPDKNTIVLLYSGMPEAALRAKAAACGAHGYICKTDDTFEFIRQINSYLKRSSGSFAALSSTKVRVAARIESAPPAEESAASTRSNASAASGAPPVSTGGGARAGSLGGPVATVLFIDDDMGILSAFRRDMQREPYQIEFALSGNQALRRILSNAPPDLVVSDILMPTVGGVEIYRQAVAASSRWRNRFLFVTGAGFGSDVANIVSGFDGLVLTKPVEGQRLRRAIREQLSALDPKNREVLLPSPG